MEKSQLNCDEFLITCGCMIVAGYRGSFVFKRACQNANALMQNLTNAYECEGYVIQPYWDLNSNAAELLREILALEPKYELKGA